MIWRDFFYKYLLTSVAESDSRESNIISIGAGNGDLEIRLAKELVNAGHKNFSLEILDINLSMLERGRRDADLAGVGEWLLFTEGDFNEWSPSKSYAVVMANQSLHHVLELERLFEGVSAAIGDDGIFLTSDMIGRNGHKRWPEIIAHINKFWKELPEPYRYNRQLDRLEVDFMGHDCSMESFEGIRAQDILPLLIERFKFELFLGFGNLIEPFVGRAFGHNFDAEVEWDRNFIDRVHAADVDLQKSGEIKPTHMIAAMSRRDSGDCRYWANLSPEFCVRSAP